jgi:hypothetical protein
MSTARNETHIVRRHARRHTLPVLLALALVAGCGDESEDSKQPSAATVAQPSTTTRSTTNQAPSLKGSLPSQVLVGFSVTFAPQASDPEGDTLTFSATGLPAWMSIDSRTGAVSGKPTAADVGTYTNIVISVSDGRTTSTLPPQTVAVVATAAGRATLSWVPPTENVDGTPITNLAGYRIRFGTSPDALIQSVEIANPGLVNYVIENLTPATWYFSVTAYTAAGVESGLSNLASKVITG